MSKSPQAKSQAAENGRPSRHHRRPYSKAGLEKRNLTLNYLKKKCQFTQHLGKGFSPQPQTCRGREQQAEPSLPSHSPTPTKKKKDHEAET